MSDATNAARVIDQFDSSLDMLRTVEAALNADSWLDKDMLQSIRNVVSRSVDGFASVRETMQGE